MSTPPNVADFIRGLARLISETDVEIDAGGVDIGVYSRSSGRYLGAVAVEDDSVDFYVSTEDSSPDVSVFLDQNLDNEGDEDEPV